MLLKRISPYVPKRDFRLAGKNGLPAESDRAERLVVRQHFHDRLKAETVKMEDVIDGWVMRFVGRGRG